MVRLDIAARNYLGVPFKHQGRNPSIGIDCIGLAQLAARDCGIVAPDWTDYARHPAKGLLESRMALVLGIRDGAVATSGAYERGEHIVDARTGRHASDWRSVTVVAADLATADAIATAALAMGQSGPAWAAGRYGCEVAAIAPDETLWTTPGIERSRIA